MLASALDRAGVIPSPAALRPERGDAVAERLHRGRGVVEPELGRGVLRLHLQGAHLAGAEGAAGPVRAAEATGPVAAATGHPAGAVAPELVGEVVGFVIEECVGHGSRCSEPPNAARPTQV